MGERCPPGQRLRSFCSALHDQGFGSESKLFGEYLLQLASIGGPVIGVVLGAWLTGRAGRKLKIKVADIELEASTQAEIDHLMAKPLELKAQLYAPDHPEVE
ncbi:UNVERIFIED_ORG: hypothetical protein J2W65_002457 [Pseudomonas parafulva]|nr:hypothetical protein [Pseudomonas parafulva]